MELQFGAMCPPLSTQLGNRVPVNVGVVLDKNAQAIDRLRIHGLLCAGEVHKARTRLIRTIQREVKMAAKSRKKENTNLTD
jgi:hypothetical protein